MTKDELITQIEELDRTEWSVKRDRSPEAKHKEFISNYIYG